jgi:hypothetical protein
MEYSGIPLAPPMLVTTLQYRSTHGYEQHLKHSVMQSPYCSDAHRSTYTFFFITLGVSCPASTTIAGEFRNLRIYG